MDKRKIIDITKKFVYDKLKGEGSGHDWWHILRVYNNAINLAKEENKEVDLFIIELAALLHDIADWKFNDGDIEAGPKVAREFLVNLNVDNNVINKVVDIIRNISFKGIGEKNSIKSLEGMIVQDADRLDAIGAIGIARAFSYGGNKNREMYNPNIKPERHENFEQYQNSKGTTINHFYEKLLFLRDLMNTDSGKRAAEKRHEFMESFLYEFYEEWEGRA